jgi:hypothetical protein
MKEHVLSVAIAISGVVTVVAGAQSDAGRMANHADHGMDMAKSVTYTGCLQKGPMGAGRFVLAHAAMVDPGHKEMMMKDSVQMTMHEHDMAEQGMDPMMTVTSAGVDLAKHVGQKVSVMGSVTNGTMDRSGSETSTLTVTSLKSLAKSCM